MRKFSLFLLVVCFILHLPFYTLKAQSTSKASVPSSSISALNGGWQRISVIVDGRVTKGAEQFRVYHDGFFTILAKDSAGGWKDTHGGTYEIEGNLYKENILYSSFPDRMGVIHWQEFTMKGDTLTFKLFNKLINYKGNVTTFPKMEMVCVRMKNK